MSWKRTAQWSWLILPLLLLALWPGVSPAQQGVRPDANAVLYEVTENMKIKREPASRVATAALMGTVQAGTPICPALLTEALGATSCSITAIASNNINLATGKGPVEGKFAMVIQGDNSVDGAEFVILRGNLLGTIDLSPAMLGADGDPTTPGDAIPLGSITARWSGRGVVDLLSDMPPALQEVIAAISAQGTIEGTFRLPFGTMDNAFYLGEGGIVPVLDNERSLAVPTVRLEIEFVAQEAGPGD